MTTKKIKEAESSCRLAKEYFLLKFYIFLKKHLIYLVKKGSSSLFFTQTQYIYYNFNEIYYFF